MISSSSSLGMPDPVFGVIPLGNQNSDSKSHRRLHDSSSLKNANTSSSNVLLPDSPRKTPSIRHLQDNPLGTISSMPPDTESKSPRHHSRMDLLIAQRELQTAHEEILRLEAEIRKARHR
jgi:hypothetical protein